jgi:hypothetical protein
MAEKIRYEVDVNASDAKRGLQDFSRAAKQAGKEAASALDDTATAGDKARAAIKAMAEATASELKASTTAAEALAAALGPELAGRVNVDQLVADLHRMGVSFDEIGTEADQFATTIREVDGLRAEVQIGADTSQVEAGVGRVKAGTDDVTAATQKSRNAMANMWGNAAQDLGQFAGIAGSAGVALGQLAEGAADAHNEGEGLGSILKGVASTAVPIAALGIGVGLISSAMANAKKKAQELDAANRRFTDGLTKTIGAADDLNSALDAAFDVGAAGEVAIVGRAFQEALDPNKINDFRHALSDLSMTSNQFISELQLAGGTFDQFIKRQTFAASGSGAVADEVATLVENFDGYSTILGSATDATADFIRTHQGLVTGLDEMNSALGQMNLEDFARNFLEAQKGTASETKAIDDAIAATNTYTDALQEYLSWKQRQNAVQSQARAGLEAEKTMWESITTATQQATDAEKSRHDQLMADVAAKQLDDEKTMYESIATATADATAAQEEHTKAVQAAAIAIGDVIDQVTDVPAALSTEFGKVNDLLAGLKFDVDFQPAMNKALDDLHGFKPDFQTLADQWANILAGKPIDIFGNVRADDAAFLDKVDALSKLFHDGAVNAFQQGGTDAANTFVQSTAAQIAASSGLDISEVYRIMGLPSDGSITTLIEPEVEKQHADQAKSILDSLAGVAPGDQRVASIQVALETGQIDGDIAYVESLLVAQDMGIPVSLDGIPQTDLDEAQRQLDSQDYTATITGEADTRDAQNQLDGVTQGWWGGLWPRSGRVATINTETPTAAASGHVLDAVAAPSGRPRTATILVKAPDAGAVNDAIDHASRDRTTHITLVTHSAPVTQGAGPGVGTSAAPGVTATAAVGAATSTMLAPSPMVAVPAVPAHVFNAHVTINTGVIGNHFDVERTVSRALRRYQRVNGRR